MTFVRAGDSSVSPTHRADNLQSRQVLQWTQPPEQIGRNSPSEGARARGWLRAAEPLATAKCPSASVD
jgi:hypothetical protein